MKTICFHCGGSLSWEEHDDPFVEHARWFPECHYIKTYKLRKSAAEELATKKAAVYSCTPHWTPSPTRNHFANLNLSLESDRLKTFDNWPVSFINKNELASAGFYYTQVDDRVICYYCNVEVGSWEMGDDPAAEHLKHSPNCRHSSHCITMLERKGASIAHASNNVPVNGSFQMVYFVFPVHGFESGFLRFFFPCYTGGQDTCGMFDVPNRRSVAYPQYAAFENRLNSFKNWPSTAKLRPGPLYEAGFFYAGEQYFRIFNLAIERVSNSTLIFSNVSAIFYEGFEFYERLMLES